MKKKEERRNGKIRERGKREKKTVLGFYSSQFYKPEISLNFVDYGRTQNVSKIR